MKRSGLGKYFSHVEITSDKTEREFLQLCEHLYIQPDNLLMVGNSLKSDIAPALNIGASAIHIPFHVTWQLEHSDDIEHDRLTKISHFSEILDLFTVYGLQFTDDYPEDSEGLANKSTVNRKPSTVNTRSYLKTVMDFSFFDKLNQAKHEETDAWWNGLNRLYNSFVYDYLYPNPSSVMAFIENHDTDRFLGNGKDTLALKQALALLLTVKRIPQLYYGTEVLMNGTKEVTDGNVRKDFPGGFPGDEHNCFTKEGRTKAEQSMFAWTSRLLHWRQNNDVIIKGSQTQFIPYAGIYVIARQYKGKTALTILNGTSKPATMEVERYQEVIGSTTKAKDIFTGRYFDLSKNLELKPRQSLVLDF